MGGFGSAVILPSLARSRLSDRRAQLHGRKILAITHP